MRLVIHTGGTKTASTSLQRAIALNEELLREHGVVVPKSGQRSKRTTNHHNIAWQFLGDRRFNPEDGDWDTLMAELKTLDAEIALLSSEGFARVASSDRMRKLFARKITEASEDVELVYVVREPLARINSMYTQSVKTFGTSGRFKPYASQALKSGFYDLEQGFKYWYEGDEAAFTAIRFDEFVGEGPLPRLLRALKVEVPLERVEAPSNESNVSPGPLAVEGMRLLGTTLKSMDWEFSRRGGPTGTISKLAQRRAAKLGWFEEKYWGWDREEALEALSLLSASNERFSQAVWGETWPFPSPAKNAMTAISLADVPPRIRHRVSDYVTSLIEKYMQLIRKHNR